jgi:hypothetical protein
MKREQAGQPVFIGCVRHSEARRCEVRSDKDSEPIAEGEPIDNRVDMNRSDTNAVQFSGGIHVDPADVERE